jgi:formylglycine-generating enzyme required for sulfatase activity
MNMSRSRFMLCLLLLISKGLFSQTASIDNRWMRKQFVRVDDGLMMAKQETTNADYRNFLDALLADGQTDLYKRCLPDTQSWLILGVQATPMVSHYFRNPAYDNYPVTGLSRTAVDTYLKWLTESYQVQSRTRDPEALFTLPTRDEWIRAAQGGDTSRVYTWGSGFIRNSRGEDLCNYRHVELKLDSVTGRFVEVPEPSGDIFKFTTRTDTYFPNTYGLFNMCGNVAEMIAEPGTVVGGSFNDPAWKVRIKSEQGFGRPSPMVGFRAAIRISKGG